MIHLSSSTRSDLSYPPKKFNLSKEIIESLKTMKMELFPDIAKQELTVSTPQKIKELYFSFVFNFISFFFFLIKI